MKKSLILALTAAILPAMAGEPVIIPTPAPTPCPMSFEIGVGYNVAGEDLIKHDVGAEKEIDTIGFDITGIYSLDENLSVNLRLGYAFGDENNKYYYPEKWETDMHVFTLMPGVRYTMPINDTISAFAGANIGLACVSVKEHGRGPLEDGGYWVDGGHDSAWGLGYSVEVGLQHKITEDVSAFVALQFAGNTAAPEGCNDQMTGGIRCGVNIKF